MKELIGAAIVIAGLYYGKVEGEEILKQVRLVALTKASQGLAPLSGFTQKMTGQKGQKNK